MAGGADTLDGELLKIENLSVSYFTRLGEIPAVVDFSLSLGPGESMGLVGETGCGKSTVAMAIMRYFGGGGKIVGGRVLFKGQDMAGLNKKQLRHIRGAEIAMVYQEPMTALNPSMTIGEQLIEVPITHDGVTRIEAKSRALKMLADVQLPDGSRIMDAYPHQLSGGQQQRVVIAMALLCSPSLLVLDEPTTALDVTVEAGIVELIAGLSRKYNTALLYISHNLGLMFDVCDRISVMYAGEVVEQGHVQSMFSWARHPYTAALFACIPMPHMGKQDRSLVPIPGQLPSPHERPRGCFFAPRCEYSVPGLCDQSLVPMTAVDENDDSHWVRCLKWREMGAHGKTAKVAQGPLQQFGDAVLEIRDMAKNYDIENRSWSRFFTSRQKRIKANADISFQVRAGETVAIVGESGCGKSTLAKVVMGLETANGGRVTVLGENLAHVPVKKRSPRQLKSAQMVFQNPHDTLNPELSIGRQITRAVAQFNGDASPDKIKARVFELLDMVKLPRGLYRRKPGKLSGGQKQRIGIARAFAGNPSMVIADEPISALDVSVAAAITELLLDIQLENRTAMLFISHDLSVVRYISNRVVVMYMGRIMEQGETETIFKPPYHPYTEALLSAVPVPDPEIKKRRIVLEGGPPSALERTQGCPFQSRCPRKLGEICETEIPALKTLSNDHMIACHIANEDLDAIPPVFSGPYRNKHKSSE